MLGIAVHRAGRDLPPPERARPSDGPDGRRRAADGGSAGRRRPVHGGPCHGQPEDRDGRGHAGSRRGPGVRAREPGRLRGTRWPDLHQARRDTAGAQCGWTPGADGSRGPPPRRGGPANRGPFRSSPGRRVVPRRRRHLNRAEPANHHAVPNPRGRRRREPRLRVRRPPTDDDRSAETPRAVPVPTDRGPAHVRGRGALRRRHPAPGHAGHARGPPRGPRDVGPPHRGRVAHPRRTRGLRPRPPRRSPAAVLEPRPAGRDRSQRGRQADRGERGLDRDVERESGAGPGSRSSTSSARTSRSSNGSSSTRGAVA